MAQAAKAAVLAGIALAIAAVFARKGADHLTLVIGAVGLGLAVTNPRAYLAVTALVLFWAESDATSQLFGEASQLYVPRGPFSITPVTAMLILGWWAAVAESSAREHRVRGLGPLNLVAILLIGCLAFGLCTGLSAHAASREAVGQIWGIVDLLLAALIVTNWARTRERIMQLTAFLAALVVAKSAIALIAYAAHKGTPLRGVTTTLATSLQPGTNWPYCVVILGALALRLHHRLSVFATAALIALPGLALYLSYRRSFVLGIALGAVVVVLLSGAARPRLRAGFLLAIAVIAILAVGQTQSEQVSGSPSLQDRLTLSDFGASDRETGDAYRVHERKNVIHAIEEHPVTGLGLGVHWSQTSFLDAYLPSIRSYTHVTVLWYWMKFGVLGLLTYAALMLSTIALSLVEYRARFRTDPGLAVIALTCGAAFVTLLFADATASFTGIDVRLSPIAGVVIGIVAAMSSLPRRTTPATTPGPSRRVVRLAEPAPARG